MLIINFEGREAKGLSKGNTTKPSLVKMVLGMPGSINSQYLIKNNPISNKNYNICF